METVKEAQLQAMCNDLASRLYKRADPQAIAVLEALEIWCQLAENLGHPSQAAAREQIGRYVKVMDRMRAVAAGIMVVNGPSQVANAGG